MASFYKLTRYVLIEKKPFWVEADYSNAVNALNYMHLSLRSKMTLLVKNHPNKELYSAINSEKEVPWVVEKKYCKRITNK